MFVDEKPEGILVVVRPLGVMLSELSTSLSRELSLVIFMRGGRRGETARGCSKITDPGLEDDNNLLPLVVGIGVC